MRAVAKLILCFALLSPTAALADPKATVAVPTIVQGVVCDSPEAAQKMSNYLVETREDDTLVILASFAKEGLGECEYLSILMFIPPTFLRTFKRIDGQLMELFSIDVEHKLYYTWAKSHMTGA